MQRPAQGPGRRPACLKTAPRAKCLLHGGEHLRREGVIVHADLGDLAVVDDHGVALGAHVAELVRGVELHIQGLGELAAGVREHGDLALGLLLLAPGLHDEGVVHGDARDDLGAGRLQLLGALDVARQVLLGAGRREGAGHGEKDALLAPEEVEDARLLAEVLLHLDVRQHVALGDTHGDEAARLRRHGTADAGEGRGDGPDGRDGGERKGQAGGEGGAARHSWMRGYCEWIGPHES
mmetsp:Transcript_249/g.827  ORF Transcript_249/g.827 Transcript_249/m.827 type:complete len:237 (-) Transcript_249:36-746(-)